MMIEMDKIDLKTGIKKHYLADVQSEPDGDHTVYSLTYEGYRSRWTEVETLQDFYKAEAIQGAA